MDNKKLKDFWENKVRKVDKHFRNQMPEYALKKTLSYFNELYEKTEGVSTVIDWGPGGGLIAKTISCDDIYFVDISKESLEVAGKYANVPKENHILLDDDFTVNVSGVDLIICCSVIQHFPTIEYFKKVCEVWNKIAPEFILIRTKISTRDKESETYFNGGHLEGLLLSKETVLNEFRQYGLKYYNSYESTRKDSRFVDGLFLLEKK